MQGWMKFLLGLLLLAVLFCLGMTLLIGLFFNPMKHEVMSTQPAGQGQANATPSTPPTETPTPTPTPVTNPPAPICTVIHEYQLKDLPEVATSSGNFLHVEYWTGGSAPEYEVILPGGRYLLQTQFAGGHVWEYAGCTFEQVKSQVDAHISRRLAQKANNGGYVNWESTGYFIPVR
jgi:hypothetical protein